MTRREKAQIKKYVDSQPWAGSTCRPFPDHILAARKFNHYGKVFDIVLMKLTPLNKGLLIKRNVTFLVSVREEGIMTGGSAILRLTEKAARKEYEKIDSSFFQQERDYYV